MIKKPSDPSLIGSLTSYICLLPTSLSRIQPSNHKLIPIKAKESKTAKNAIRLERELEMRIAKAISNRKGAITIPILILFILSEFKA